MTRKELGARIEELITWPRDYADAIDNDPRCDHDDVCPYNSIHELELAWEKA